MKKTIGAIAMIASLVGASAIPSTAFAQQQQQDVEVVNSQCGDAVPLADGNHYVYCVFTYSDGSMRSEWSRVWYT